MSNKTETISLQEMLTASGTKDPDLLARAYFEASGHSANFFSQLKVDWDKFLPAIKTYIINHKDREKNQASISEDQQLETIANRPQRRQDYEDGLKKAGITVMPDPIIIALRGYVGDGYRTTFEVPQEIRGALITGASFKDHRAPSGVTYRNVMLYTDGNIGKPPFIDALINGVRVLLEWNGSSHSGGEEWSAMVLTEDETDQIETWRDGA